MKTLVLLSMPIWFFTFMISCKPVSEDQETVEDLNDAIDSLDVELINPLWKSETDDDFFKIELPGRMYSRDDLNDEASLQYGYVQDMGNQVLEHYVVVLLEPKDSIRQEEKEHRLNLDFDVYSYNDFSVEGISGGLDSFVVFNPKPRARVINGMDCIINELRGNMGDVGIYYELAVFEGERAFYQVLTWCIESQKQEFVDDMEKIISSFKELEGETAELHKHIID